MTSYLYLGKSSKDLSPVNFLKLFLKIVIHFKYLGMYVYLLAFTLLKPSPLHLHRRLR